MDQLAENRSPENETSLVDHAAGYARLPFLAVAALVVAAGLVLRLVPWGLPLAVRHYGGGVLWGAMVLLLVAAARPSSWGAVATILAAALIAVAVELTRLAHGPSLDAFRGTLAGQLLLGRIFSPWDVFAYGIGIAGAAAATWRHSWPCRWGLAAPPRI